MRITLKQILDRLEEFAGEHYQIYSFDFGSLTDLNTKDKTDYPLIYVTLDDSTIDGPEMRLNLNVAVLDLEKQDKSNLEDIMNKTLLIGNDIITRFFQEPNTQFKNQIDLWRIVDNNVMMQPVEFVLDDHAAGWLFKFELSIENGDCGIPMDNWNCINLSGSTI